MELTEVPVLVATLIVVYAVSHVARLLYLSHETAGTNSMDTAGGNEEHIALMSLMTG